MDAVYKQQRLNQLLEERTGGAINIGGIRFQLLYSILRAFDLYGPDAPDAIQLEAVEDLDVRGNKRWEIKKLVVSNQFVQMKTSKTPWEWGRFSSSGIVQNFLPVWASDPTAELLVVTNFSYKAGLDEFAKYCSGKRGGLSKKVNAKLEELCKKEGYPAIKPLQLAKQIRFIHVHENELLDQIKASIVKHFDLAAPNADLYYSVLMARFLDLAVQRKEVGRQDLESFRFSIQEDIDRGAQNLAVQNCWLERLQFTPDDNPEDYYEGKNARAGHVLAGMDVPRPEWVSRIREVLQRSKVCVVRASSGQGKSTLLYRYAYEHYNPETTFIVRQLSDETMLGPVKQAIVARLSLGIPILVLVDNVGSNLKYWSRLTADLSGQNIRFLVSIREEDWYRYSGRLSGFDWEVVTPALSLSEARSIFAAFREQGKVAASVQSAEWAYEKIADRRLLIEFTYLITHGQMLEERLKEQVQEIDQLGEDPAKLQILRLVSVAQVYGARIASASLLRCIQFQRDPDLTLKSLEGEYILQIDGMYEGLHYVRSQHLISLLHNATPVEKTVNLLIRHLDQDNLELLVSAVFAAPDLSHELSLSELMERCASELLAFSNRMVMGLFTASELTYYRLHKHIFDSAFEQIGSAAIFMLCSSSLPFPTVNLLDTLRDLLGDERSNVTTLSELSTQFGARHWEDRFEVRLLQHVVEKKDAAILNEDLSHIGTFLDWCRLPGVDPSRLVALLSAHDWRAQIYQADINASAGLLSALSQDAPQAYQQLMSSDKTELMSYFKKASDTLRIEESGNDISIEFIVNDQESQNEQAVNRLRYLRKIFSGYQRYCSDGLFPSLLGSGLSFHTDTNKQMPRENLDLELDAEKNRAYLRAVESEYAAESMFDWQKQWFDLRKELLRTVCYCLNYYVVVLGRKRMTIDELVAVLNAALYQCSHIKGLPFSFSTRFQKEVGDLREWTTNMSNFIEQFAGHDPHDANHQLSRLMRYNLNEALKNLSKAQKAMQIITENTHPYFSFHDLDATELTEYAALSEVVDFWFEGSNRQVSDVRAAAATHREEVRAQFVETIHTTLQPLEAQGFHFTYPNRPLESHPLRDICLGFEIESYQSQILQLTQILTVLSQLPLEYHFLNVAPLAKGKLISPTVLRISRDSILQMIEGGDHAVAALPLIPVHPPEGFFDVLPIEMAAPSKEMQLLGDFYAICGSLNSIRNTLYFLKDRLDQTKPFERELMEKYQHHILEELNTLSEKKQRWLAEALEVAQENSAASQWINFYEICSNRFQNFDELPELDAEGFEPLNILVDLELLNAFHQYMDVVEFSSRQSPQMNTATASPEE